mmetsp:Transcript_3450/g.5548  ORF Transcript_3450/g.5548 Transcript_3450/m.5548 type:complete len:258 (-) Transcript_3450:1760-2533(-)
MDLGIYNHTSRRHLGNAEARGMRARRVAQIAQQVLLKGCASWRCVVPCCRKVKSKFQLHADRRHTQRQRIISTCLGLPLLRLSLHLFFSFCLDALLLHICALPLILMFLGDGALMRLILLSQTLCLDSSSCQLLALPLRLLQRQLISHSLSLSSLLFLVLSPCFVVLPLRIEQCVLSLKTRPLLLLLKQRVLFLQTHPLVLLRLLIETTLLLLLHLPSRRRLRYAIRRAPRLVRHLNTNLRRLFAHTAHQRRTVFVE